MTDDSFFATYSCNDRSLIEYNNFGQSIQARRWYQHDIDQIVYSTAFRKMQKKYQLLSNFDPRCRTRMVHTLEVNRIAKEIGEKLQLNTDLIECIALAHDVANTAYGNVSNSFLAQKTKNMFSHEEAGGLMIRYATRKELKDENKHTAGMEANDRLPIRLFKNSDFSNGFEVYKFEDEYWYTSISDEVVDGVIHHQYKLSMPCTLEGQVVRFSDNIAYMSQDIGDMIETGVWDKNKQSEFLRLHRDILPSSSVDTSKKID